jgi:hypothetical protein
MAVESASSSSPVASRTDRYFSIRLHLLLLVGTILLPVLALVAAISWHYVDAARQTIAAQRLDVANNLTNLAERETASIAGLLEGLAASQGFLDGDPVAVEVAAELARARGLESVAVFDTRDRRLLTTLRGTRQAFPTADQADVQSALSEARAVVSELRASPGTPPLFFVSVPISLHGRPKVVVSGGVPASRLQGLFAEAGLRDGWRAGIIDRAGVIVARSRDPEAYVGKPAQQPMIAAARGHAASGVFDIVSRDGVEVRNAFRRSPITNWTVGVAVPASVENAPLWVTSLSMTALGLGLILVGLVLSVTVANRIAHAVRMIGRAAVALVTGDSVPLPKATLVELRDVLRLIESLSLTRPKGAYTQS